MVQAGLAFLLAVTTLSACGDPEDTGTIQVDSPGGDSPDTDSGHTADADGDGHAVPEDCDDDDPAVHPEAEDVCGDGVDQDCSGTDLDCRPFLGTIEVEELGATIETGEGEHLGLFAGDAGDLDHDGLGDVLVGMSDGSLRVIVGASLGGVVTTDTAWLILEDATSETTSSDGFGGLDLDGDGEEDLFVGDGSAEATLAKATLLCGPFTGGSGLASAQACGSIGGEELLGRDVVSAGDLDGDGHPEVLVSSHQSFLLLRGPLQRADLAATDADVVLTDPSVWGSYRDPVGLGDVNGDGYGDVASVTYRSASWPPGDLSHVVLGPIADGEFNLQDADTILSGNDQAEVGTVLGPGDVDGDGVDDLMVSSSGSNLYRGSVAVFRGPLAPGSIALEDADAAIWADRWVSYSGAALTAAGDLDGDGRDDVLLSAWSQLESAHLFYGRDFPRSTTYSQADASFANTEDLTSASRTGDLDGDGVQDLLLYQILEHKIAVLLTGTPTVGSDLDRDTFADDEDCDDADPARHPARPEDCSDSVDQDCDGDTASPCPIIIDASATTHAFSGDMAGELVGSALALAGDMDGDGEQDVAIGAPRRAWEDGSSGRVYLVRGPLPEEDLVLGEAASVLDPFERIDGLGQALAGGADLTGDGVDDLVVVGDEAWVVPGPWMAEDPAPEIATVVALPASKNPATPADLTGDGLADLILGVPDENAPGDEASSFVVLYANPLPEGRLEEQDARTSWSGSGEGICEFLDTVEDLTGDGLADLLVGSGSEAFLMPGPVEAGAFRFDDAPVKIVRGTESTAFWVMAPLADATGDGTPDLLVAAQGDDGAGTWRGVAYVLPGPLTSSEISLSDAHAVIEGARDGDALGSAAVDLGDVDGDGQHDIAIGAKYLDADGLDGGLVYIFHGTLPSGTWTTASADRVITGLGPGVLLGEILLAPGDMTGDGTPDLLLGQPNEASVAPWVGAVRLLSVWD